MAKKPSITNISSGYQGTTTINSNLTNIRDAFDNTLSLDGSTPNAMQADLDLNNNDLINAKDIYAVNIIASGSFVPATEWDILQQAQDAADTATAQASIATANTTTSTAASLAATAAKNSAEAARDSALATGNIYASTAAGLAASTVGEYFSVPTGTAYDYLILYRVDAGPVATEVKRYPSSALVENLANSVDSVIGTGATHVLSDTDGNVILHIKENGGLHLLTDTVSVQTHIEDLEDSVQKNEGSDAIVAFTDNDGRVVANIDKNLELNLAGNLRSIQAGVASNYIFTAMRYASESNTAKASYWYDRAENEFPVPVRLEKLIALENTDSSIQRMPVITRVSSGRLLYMWHQIRKPVFSDGEGVRLMQCFVDYNLETSTLTTTTPVVFEQPAGWTTNTGCNQSPHLITLPNGKIICVFAQQDAPSGLIVDDDRNIYVKSSTDGGVTWTAKTKIISAPGVVPRYALTGASGDFVRIPAGTYAGRIVFTIYESNGNVSAVYSDNEGVTWTKGSAVTATGFTVNESTISVRSDNSLIMNMRTEGNYQLVYATSTNGGATWTFQGARTGWQSSNCASSMVQTSSSPLDGYKKLIWSGLDNAVSYQRKGLVLRVSHDDGVTYQTQYRPIESGTPAGYSCVRMIEPNVLAVAWENGFNGPCSSYLYIVNLSEVYTNGTHS